MPYIKLEDRGQYYPLFDLAGQLLDEETSAGDLNYVITNLCRLALGDQPGYTRFNEVVGILECVKLELYRRKISSYEDQKIKENGDVY